MQQPDDMRGVLQDIEQRATGLQQQVAAFAVSAAVTAAALVNPLPAAADLVQVGVLPDMLQHHAVHELAAPIRRCKLFD
jgi:hypothetical protein